MLHVLVVDYVICAALLGSAAVLLDLEEPHRILRRSAEPLLVPEAPFEREGFVPGFCCLQVSWRAGNWLRAFT